MRIKGCVPNSMLLTLSYKHKKYKKDTEAIDVLVFGKQSKYLRFWLYKYSAGMMLLQKHYIHINLMVIVSELLGRKKLILLSVG